MIAAYLDDVGLDLDAARRLAVTPPNRLAAFHLQQAAEKLVKAVHIVRGIRPTAEHHIDLLVAALPAEDTWRAKLSVLDPLSAFATAFRYPSPTGNRKDGPLPDEVARWIRVIGDLVAEARTLT